MRRLYLILFFIAPIALHAQDITGIWRGHFRSSGSLSMKQDSYDERYRFEVQIAQHDKKFEGITYSYLSSIFYGKAAAAGTINVHTGKVMLQEGKLLELRHIGGGGTCIMTCFLQYSRSGDEEFLEGTYVSMNISDSTNCGRGTVFLRKTISSDFYTEPFVLKRAKELSADSAKTAHKATIAPPSGQSTAKVTPPTTRATTNTKPGSASLPAKPKPGSTTSTAPKPGSTASTQKPGAAARATPSKPAGPPERNPPPMARASVPGETMRQPMSDSGTGIGRKFPTIVPGVIKNRENPTVKTIVVHTTEITLNIYDDGAIDHDTVSVYLDNRPVILHAMLTDRPLVLTIHLDESNDYHEVVMVADNEGEIPPNTSLMIIKAGDKEYKVNITSTEQKNAVIKFQYAK